MESRSSSPSPGQSGQDDREEDADSPLRQREGMIGGAEIEQYADDSADLDLIRLDHEARSNYRQLESNSEAVAQNTEQDSDEDYEMINVHLPHRYHHAESLGAAATSSSSSSAVVPANSVSSRNNQNQLRRANVHEEPGSSSQLTQGANSVGGSSSHRGAMMLADEDIDPEIDSAVSNHFILQSNGASNVHNYPAIGDSNEYWQASSSSSTNMISSGAFNVEDEIRRLDNESEHHSLEEDREDISFDNQVLVSEPRRIPHMEEDHVSRRRDEPREGPSTVGNGAVQYSVVSVPHFSPQPSTSTGSSSNRNVWYSASAGPSTAGPSSSSNYNLSNQLGLPSTSAQGSSDISNSHPNSASSNTISTSSASIVSGHIDNSQDPTTSSVGIPPLYSFAASSSPSSLTSSHPTSQQFGGGLLSSSGDVGPIPPSSNNIFQSPHGEISNPPSPLGGRVNPAEQVNKRDSDDRPESPEAGPSGSQNFAAKRGIDAALDVIEVCDDSERAKKLRSNSNRSSIDDNVNLYQLPDVEDLPSMQSPINEEREEDNDDSDRSYEPQMYRRDFATSEATAAPRPVSPAERSSSRNRNEIQDDVSDDVPSPSPRIRHSPLHFNPHTPADQYLISSSTGVGNDSVPSTPVDLHGDNDLSVPSPYRPNIGLDSRREQSPILFRGNNYRNRIEDDVDDMIDSTVDSSGLPLAEATNNVIENHLENEANGYGVESSHYEDSSDDENCNMDSSTNNIQNNAPTRSRRIAPIIQNDSAESPSSHSHQLSINIVNDFYGNHSRSCGNSNDGSISTSGQVDDGHFRLVPNESDGIELEDDTANAPFESVSRNDELRMDHVHESHVGFDEKEDLDSQENSLVKLDDSSREHGSSSSSANSYMNQQRSPPKQNVPNHRPSNGGTGKTSDRRLIKSSSNRFSQRHPAALASTSSSAHESNGRRRNVRENGDHATTGSNAPSQNQVSYRSNHSGTNGTNNTINIQNPVNKELRYEADQQSVLDLNNPQNLVIMGQNSELEHVNIRNDHLSISHDQENEQRDGPSVDHENQPRSKLVNGKSRSNNLNNNSSSTLGFHKHSGNEFNSRKLAESKIAEEPSNLDMDKKERQMVPSVPNTIDISLAFSGIPQSLSSNTENEVYTHNQQASSSSKSTAVPLNSAGHHSSILESMTGPLSKRLRTLHSLQQQQDSDSDERDIPSSKQKSLGAHLSQDVHKDAEIPRNGNHGQPVNGGHRGSNLLFQHLIRHQDSKEDINTQMTRNIAVTSNKSSTSDAVKMDKSKKNTSDAHEVELDQPSTSRSNSGQNAYPNGDNVVEASHGRSNGDSVQRDDGHGHSFLGGTQQTFSVTSIETVGRAATDALRSYSGENGLDRMSLVGNTNDCQKKRKIDNNHQFVAPDGISGKNQRSHVNDKKDSDIDAILAKVMDPGANRKGGSGSNWIDPKNEYEPTFNRIRRRRNKFVDTSMKENSTLRVGEQLEKPEAKKRPLQTSNSVIQIQDKPVLTRAMASLPSNYLIIRSISRCASLRIGNGTLPEGKGVFARKMIPKSCRFGPLEGVEVSILGQTGSISSFGYLNLSVIKENGDVIKIDVEREESSNWMRFVRAAEFLSEQNLVITQEGNSLFYTTTRAIEPKEELKVGYSATYAKTRGLKELQEFRNSDIELHHLSEPLNDRKNKQILDNSSKQPLKVLKHPNDSSSSVRFGNNHASTGIANERTSKQEFTSSSSTGSSPQLIKTAEHIRQYSNEPKALNCPICPRTFDRQYSLERHIILHKADKKYECNECDAKYSLAANLTRHQRQVHMSKESSDNHKENSESPATLSETIQGIKENAKYNSCVGCELSFLVNSDAYRIHQYCHRAQADLSDDPFLESRIVQQSIGAVSSDGSYVESKIIRFLCTDCPETFDSWDQLITHSANHGVLSNSLPEVKVYDENNLASNNPALAKHLGKPHKCELCYKSFASEERLSVGLYFC